MTRPQRQAITVVALRVLADFLSLLLGTRVVRELLTVKAKQPCGPPMTLGNMRYLGVQRLVATCLNDACRHQGLINVSNYPADTEVPSFASKVV